MKRETIQLKLNDIKLNEHNPRTINKLQLDKLVKSVQEFPEMTELRPIVVDETNTILGGNMRYRAMQKLGMSTTEVVKVSGLTDEQKREFIIKDNVAFGDWDWDALANEWDTDELNEWGLDIPEPDKVDQEVEEVDVPEVKDGEPKAKLGDMYQLGRHRLMCGDSTDVTAVDRLMDGVKAKLLLTDPPYGIDVVKGNKVSRDKAFGKVGGENIVKSKTYSAIIGDDTTDTARANYDVALTCTENQIIFGGNYFTDFLPPSRCWVVWDKQNTGDFADAELAWTSFNKGVRLYHFLWNGLCREGSREVEGKTRVHPTQKPVGMLADILKDFSEENDSILDCFGGSGSTLIACEQLNRKCYMMELDPHYVDVIIERWEHFTGQKAELISEAR